MPYLVITYLGNTMRSQHLQEVETSTLQERVYRSLRATILDGLVGPGEVLAVRPLANMLGTSVMPVRDALLRLQTEGAVEAKAAGRQLSIPVMTREGIEELYDIRLELEGRAAAMAARRVTDRELEKIEKLVAEMEDAIVRSDELGFQRANRAFHFTIYAAAKSHHLLPMIEALWLKLGPLLRVPLLPGSRAQHRVMAGGQHRHEEAVAGLRSHDPDAARAGIQGDLRDTASWFLEHYDPEAYRAELEGTAHAH